VNSRRAVSRITLLVSAACIARRALGLDMRSEYSSTRYKSLLITREFL
jgi:hypothetical protein